MGSISTSEKENKLKFMEISGFSSKVTNEKLFCENEGLKTDASRSIMEEEFFKHLNCTTKVKNSSSIPFLI